MKSMTKGWFLYLLSATLIEVWTGHADLQLLAFPVGIALGVAALAVLFVLDREQGNHPWLCSLRSPRMAGWLLALLTLGCIIGGCLPAASRFQTSWPFIALLAALFVHLTLLLLHRLRRFCWKRDGTFLLIHGGLWLALSGGMLGAGDTDELRIRVGQEEPVTTGVNAQGRLKPLGHALQLKEFHIETHPTDGFPVQYTAAVWVDNTPVRLAVNSPYAVRPGEDLYLMSFDPAGATGEAAFCILLLVRQPWKYPLLAGILLLMAGVARMMWKQP